jgi:plastocyanin
MARFLPVLIAFMAIAHASASALAQDKPGELQAICAEAEAEAAKQGLLPSRVSKDGKGFTILMYKYRFCPSTAKIARGTTVTWINIDKRTSHSVWLKDSGQEESERLFNSDTLQKNFDRPGHYKYLCGPHWEKEGMVGGLEITQ